MKKECERPCLFMDGDSTVICFLLLSAVFLDKMIKN